MKRKFGIAVFITILGFFISPWKVSGTSGFISPCSSPLIPPFLSTGVKPNILILLDNSQSMDEDFTGNAVGSYASNSKSLQARQALQNVVKTLETKANVGIMSFTLSRVTSRWYLYNGMPFASYDPYSYCPINYCSDGNVFQSPLQKCSQDADCASPYSHCLPDTALIQPCVDYCTNPANTTAETSCDSVCPQVPFGSTTDGSMNFTKYQYTGGGGADTNGNYFPDEIIGNYAYNNPIRARYCANTYPKTNEYVFPYTQWNGTTGTRLAYYKRPDAGYFPNTGVEFYYSSGGNYNPGECTSPTCNNYSTYDEYMAKTDTSDANSGYNSNDWNGRTGVVPTDSDYALGFYNFGRRLPQYPVGNTWFSSNNVTSGYLNVAIGDVNPVDSGNQYTTVYNMLDLGATAATDPPTSDTYMNTCTASDMNTCSYIVNAGNTPTAAALQSALQYFNGTYTPEGQSSSPSSPIAYRCQKNYIILVTDGMPDTLLDGTQTEDLSSVMPQVLAGLEELDGLSSPTAVSGVTPALPSGYTWTNIQKTFSDPVHANQSTNYTFPVQTYVLGIGSEANSNLDQMAVAGGADNNGHAYYATNTTQLNLALSNIVNSILGRVASGSSISVLSTQTQTGANMFEGVFYPQKFFATKTMLWPGFLYDWWFYNGLGQQYCASVDATTGLATFDNPLASCTQASDCPNSGDQCVQYTIREDTTHNITNGQPDDILDLTGPNGGAGGDESLDFLYTDQSGLQIARYRYAGSGSVTAATQYVDTVGLDDLSPIWEAGKMLWATPADTNHRTICTPGTSTGAATSPCGIGSNLVSFDPTSDPELVSASSPLGASSNLNSCLGGSLSNLVNYVRGVDITGCRSRTVGLCQDSAGNTTNTGCASSADCTNAGLSSCVQNTWKLGDIIYSSPQVEADYTYCASVNTSGIATFTSTACGQDSDCASLASTDKCLKKETVVFAGANDGMLHAFETGTLSSAGLNPSDNEVDKLTGIPTSNMGQELWAFIPRNVLPYLRCLAVPATDPSSCHIYYNDLSPYLTTMNINTTNSSGATVTSTRKVLIGGLRFGGGSVGGPLGLTPENYCLSGPNGTGLSDGTSTCSNNTNQCPSGYKGSCGTAYPTNVPADTCPNGGVVACANPGTCYDDPASAHTPAQCIGLSSYYALDITDVEHPKLLWEFSDPALGYSLSGPAVIHEPADSTAMTGDRYFVMFLSGPTDAQDGSSIQDLQAFVLTLDPASLGLTSVYYHDFNTSTTKNGFGGRLFTNGLDVNADSYTDYVFFGYAASPNGKTGSWSGGIAKIDMTGNGLSPGAWNWDVNTYANVPQVPITAQVMPMQCFGNWYLYAGTGRYFFTPDSYGSNGNSGYNFIMGVPFCASYNNNCGKGSGNTNINFSNTSNNNACSDLTGTTGLSQAYWLRDLDPATSPYLAERMVTDPTATPNNIVYFTTAEPVDTSVDPCGSGGRSRMWGLNCATGLAITDTSCPGYSISNESGVLYLQTSTGAIYAVTPSSSFTGNSGQTTAWHPGMPPNDHPPAPPPSGGSTSGQIIQWIEK